MQKGKIAYGNLASLHSNYYNVITIIEKRLDKNYNIYNASQEADKKGELSVIKSYIIDTESNEQLGKHFKVKEFACKDGSPVVFIDEYLWTVLDILRTKVGRPVIVTSGYRTPDWNKKTGGAKYSYHMRGMAADIRVNGMTPKQVASKLSEIVPDECGIIVYKSWVHFDVRTSKYRKGV